MANDRSISNNQRSRLKLENLVFPINLLVMTTLLAAALIVSTFFEDGPFTSPPQKAGACAACPSGPMLDESSRFFSLLVKPT